MKTTKQRKRERIDARFRRQFHSAGRIDWFKNQPSEISGRVDPQRMHNCHMRSRGAGGTYKDIVPLLAIEHHDLDTMRNAKFEAKYKRTKQSVRDRAPHYDRLWREAA